jgi:plasmid maintenance system antidote protein VapI
VLFEFEIYNINHLKYDPDYAVHPGEYLEEVLRYRGISIKDFAFLVGVPENDIDSIISKEKEPTSDLVKEFEKVLGISSGIWTGMIDQYRAQIWTQKWIDS